jgi:RNA polymerase sigma factor (sigma-70 family)
LSNHRERIDHRPLLDDETCLETADRDALVVLNGSEDAVLADVVDPADAVALKRRITLLASAIGDLDPLHREVILLRDIQERSAPEAAAELGISIDALKSRLHRARISLRDHVLQRASEQ